MKDLMLKILQQIARNHNTDVSEFFGVFMTSIAVGIDIEIILEHFNSSEKEILKKFFNYLKNDVLYEIEEFSKEFVKVVDIQKAFENLAPFFIIFIPEDVIHSKDVEKLEEILEEYSEDMRKIIFGAIDMLSLADEDISEKKKLEILEILVGVIITLAFMMKDIHD